MTKALKRNLILFFLALMAISVYFIINFKFGTAVNAASKKQVYSFDFDYIYESGIYDLDWNLIRFDARREGRYSNSPINSGERYIDIGVIDYSYINASKQIDHYPLLVPNYVFSIENKCFCYSIMRK